MNWVKVDNNDYVPKEGPNVSRAKTITIFGEMLIRNYYNEYYMADSKLILDFLYKQMTNHDEKTFQDIDQEFKLFYSEIIADHNKHYKAIKEFIARERREEYVAKLIN